MRAPFQILIFPFIKDKVGYLYAIFKRSDLGFWQGISGGGEDAETPIEAVKRELFEET
ncbi:MAG: NUDIX domain-containing protein, partial [Nanoarchaeota archaeon]|nr:NUDIX domain-containing protein [Nanoarchaeota archaeon]